MLPGLDSILKFIRCNCETGMDAAKDATVEKMDCFV